MSQRANDVVIVALDGMSREAALGLAEKLRDQVWGFKVNDLLVEFGVEIVRAFGDAEVFWEMDGERMAQVFRNLAMNAVHAMPTGGELRVAIDDDGAVTFCDEGAGFSDEALERWGELFFSTKEGGMGIGLSVAAEIVRAHGGELRVANRESGAEVSVNL